LSSVKILSGKKLGGSRDQLIRALLLCSEKRIRLIHLSIGSVDFRDFDEIRKTVGIVTEQGAIIIAACNNRNIYTCPASLADVIGVKCDLSGNLEQGEWIWNSFAPDGIEITACGRHYLDTGMANGRWTAASNSFAAPMITAEVYNLLLKEPSLILREIKGRLKELAKAKEARAFSSGDAASGPHRISVPLVAIYDENQERASRSAGRLALLFRSNGYNAATADSDRIAGSPHISLADLCRPGSFDYFEGLLTLDSVYDPDLILLTCNSPAAIETIEEKTEIDITIIHAGKKAGDACELVKKNKKSKLIVLGDSVRDTVFTGIDVTQLTYREDEFVEELYETIVDMFEKTSKPRD
jgi:hypothetical protein